jgi:signal transduction histidine kinase
VETRALSRRSPPRALYAALLLAGLIAALLVAWFLSGWRDVQAHQREAQAEPVAVAEQRARDLARELRGQLEQVMAREGERPYFQYQNLFHDPKASLGLSVTPSPLAKAPEDQLVRGYFQVDRRGHVTTPTINDDVPGLSDQPHLAQSRAFRDEVARQIAAAVIPRSKPLVASRDNNAQVLNFDPGVYAQNAAPNQVYQQQAPAPAVAEPITITVSPLEWKTFPFDGTPSLVALRQVQTPDGQLTQGFVLDRATLTSWLATRAGDMVARVGPGEATATEIAPGWQLSIEPNPRASASATHEAAAIARAFVLRFVVIGLLAAAAAAAVVWLVARAERLARERSQFAAAAAHELRTPLAGLQLYGDMLADGLGDPAKLRDYARRMSEEASRLGRVVSNVLDFSRLERGNLSVDAQLGTVGETLRELSEHAQPALDRAGAALELDVASDLRACFDRDALTRILGNLLDNAEKYARGADDRTIRLAARDLGDAIEILVEDRGPGVADGGELFRPFSRGVGGDGPAGLGLGLAMSQSLARAMGGELAYRPRSGGGATFALRLPRA